MRCPACQKLYQVETEAIFSHTPHFECKACRAVFAFEYPPSQMDRVMSFVVKPAELTTDETAPVILQAQPSLVQLWNNIFEDYEDEERHEDFVKRCRELEGLPFARMKYQDLTTALGSDPLSEKYLKQVDGMMLVKVQMDQPSSQSGLSFSFLARIHWRRLLYWTPLVMSLGLIVLGFSSLALRNLIGFGVAVGFLSYGLIVLVRGRLRWSDFVD